jgi:hypothetical protein
MAGAGLRRGLDGGGELRHEGGISRWRVGWQHSQAQWREERDGADGQSPHVSERKEKAPMMDGANQRGKRII